MKKCLLLLVSFLAVSTIVSAAQFKTKPLTKELRSYITKTYKAVPHKKLVLYIPDESPNCPYGQAFMNALTKQKSRTDLKGSYSFQAQITHSSQSYATAQEADAAWKKMSDFFNACGFLCIISLEKNWIYSIGNAVGFEEAKALPKLFTTFKSKP